MKRISDYYMPCPNCGLRLGKSAFKAYGWVKHRENGGRGKECLPKEKAETD